MKVKSRAKAYSLSLEIGAIRLNEIINWADEVITIEKEPSYEFIELACCKNKNDAITYLNLISQGCDLEYSFKLVFSIFLTAINSGVLSHSVIAQKLYFLIDEYSEIEEYGEMYFFWDDIDLAEDGVCGDILEEKEKLVDFLSKNKIDLNSTRI